MAVEAGREYNPDSAKDTRPKAFSFMASGLVFRYTLEIPEYILVRLNARDVMDKLQEYMNAYTSRVVDESIKGGYFHTDSGGAAMRRDIGRHLLNYIWERFSIRMEQEGIDCFQVAPTLQEVLK